MGVGNIFSVQESQYSWNLNPYKVKVVYELVENDFDSKVEFCENLRQNTCILKMLYWLKTHFSGLSNFLFKWKGKPPEMFILGKCESRVIWSISIKI